jgi:hypothetical protein
MAMPYSGNYFSMKFLRTCISQGRWRKEREICELPEPEARDLCKCGVAVPHGMLAKAALGSLVPRGVVEPSDPDPAMGPFGTWIKLWGRVLWDPVQGRSVAPEHGDVLYYSKLSPDDVILEDSDRDSSRPSRDRPFVEIIGLDEEYRLKLLEQRRQNRARNPVDVKVGKYGCAGLVVPPPWRDLNHRA